MPHTKKFYAIKYPDGRTKIVSSWAECKTLITGSENSGREYKSFPTEEAAATWLGNATPIQPPKQDVLERELSRYPILNMTPPDLQRAILSELVRIRVLLEAKNA